MVKKTRFLVQAGVIAALYCALVILASVTPFAMINFGLFQVRLSEALTVLPYFTPAAIPGLFVGCLIANIISSPFGMADIVFGSLATLTAAFCSFALRRWKWLVPLPPVVINAFAVPLIILIGSESADPYLPGVLSVGAGQVVACYVLGMVLLFALEKRSTIFK